MMIPGTICVLASCVLAQSPQAAAPRGGAPLSPIEHTEDFQNHPISSDPVFDRFQVLPGEGQVDPTFVWELFNGVNAIPSIFVVGQTDANGTPDPLPRWQGVVLQQTGSPLAADLNNDGAVDTADLGLLIGAFGQAGKGLAADINGDGVVDTADLGALISGFGVSLGAFCVYEITQVLPTDNFGEPIDPSDLSKGPAIGDLIGFETSPDCGVCDTFTLDHEETGVSFIGE